MRSDETPEISVRDTLDERGLRELHALYQGEWWTRGRGLEDVRRAVAGADVVVALCAEPSGRLVGFARVLTDRIFKALVLDVIVAPERRARGLGRLLLQTLVDHPELRGVRHLELYCLPELVPFYERWGFSTDVGGVRLMRRSGG